MGLPRFNVPENIELQNVDLSVKLEILTFNLALREHESVGKTACHDMEI